MSREIKFRAWHKYANYMCQNVQTDFLDRDYLEFMQYTGLKDKNAKKIYEGDILQDSFQNAFGELFEQENYKVEFINGCWCLLGKRINDCRPADTEMDLHSHFYFNEFDIEYFNKEGNLKYFEVIGNIYENPELLKED